MNVAAKKVIETLHLEGISPEDIFTLISVDTRTVKAIPLNELLFTFNMRGMLSRDDQNDSNGSKWRGSLRSVSIAVKASEDSLSKAAFLQFFSHITNDRNETLDLTDKDFAKVFALIKATFADGQLPDGSLFPSTEDFEAIEALGGGLLFTSVTLEDVQAVIAEHEAEEKRNTVLEPFLEARLQVAKEQIADGTITETSQIAAVFEVAPEVA